MNSAVVICAEGVLYRPNDSFSASEPIFDGLTLTHLLTARHIVHVVCNTEKRQFAEMWMKLNGVREVQVHTHEIDDGFSQIDFYWQQIRKIRAGGPVWMVLSAYDELLDRCADAGLLSLKFNRPGTIGGPPERAPWSDRVKGLRADALSRIATDEEERSRTITG